MKNTAWVLVGCLVSCAVVGNAAAAEPAPCAYEEIRDGKIEVEPGASGKDPSIKLLKVDPVEGAWISRDTMLRLDVEFAIPDFRPGTYFLMVRFRMAGGDSMTPETNVEQIDLTSARGHATVCAPLAEVFDNPRVRWPLSVVVSVNQRLGDGSTPLADTHPVSFSALDTPAAAVAGQAKEASDEYVTALSQAFSYFASKRALNEVCVRLFPDMREEFARTYPAWAERHDAVIEWVDRLQRERYASGTRNGGQGARQIDESVRRLIAGKYEALGEPLRETCRALPGELSDPTVDIEVVLGKELRILRKWQ